MIGKITEEMNRATNPEKLKGLLPYKILVSRK
jgi:hypothetical protein